MAAQKQGIGTCGTRIRDIVDRNIENTHFVEGALTSTSPGKHVAHGALLNRVWWQARVVKRARHSDLCELWIMRAIAWVLLRLVELGHADAHNEDALLEGHRWRMYREELIKTENKGDESWQTQSTNISRILLMRLTCS